MADIAEILQYLTEHAGTRVARRYAVDFDQTIARIAEFPGIGAPRPEFGPSARLSLVAPYLVLYDGGPESEEAVVLRILDGRRDITVELIKR